MYHKYYIYNILGKNLNSQSSENSTELVLSDTITVDTLVGSEDTVVGIPDTVAHE